MNKGKKIYLIFSIVLIIGAILLCLPFVQNILLILGEKIIGRPLKSPEFWVGRMYIMVLSFITISFITIFYIFIDSTNFKVFNEKNTDKIDLIVVLLTFSFLAFCYIFHCTESSLWYDEGIEYWVSKSIADTAYGFDASTPNMYTRICRTIQPPLYNILMFIWLKICDTEFWFKFFGVICFFVGNIAFYFTCREFSNKRISSLMTLIFGTSRIFITYSHEAAEYTCLFCFVCWMTLYFVKALKSFSWKNIVLYFLFATLSIYSQYGAAFAIIGTAIVLFFHCFKKTEEASIKQKCFRFLLSGISTVILFIIPLLLFFVKYQLLGYIKDNDHSACFEYGNIVIDYFISFINASSYFFNKMLIVCSCIMILGIFLRRIRYKILKFSLFEEICVGTFFSWTSYYFAVRYNIYKVSYTSGFGNRWGMSFCSIFGVLFAISIIEFYKESRILKKKNLSKIILCSCVFIIFSFNVKNIIKGRDIKCYVREAYQYLNENDVHPILVEHWYVPTLSYYILHDKKSNIDINNCYKILRHAEYENKQNIRKEFEGIISNINDETFYLFCGNEPTNYETTVTVFNDMGFFIVNKLQFDEKDLGDPTILKVTKQ